MCSKPRQDGYKTKMRKSELLRMTFTNNGIIPKKDIIAKNQEDSTQLKMQTKYQPNAKTNFRTPGL